MPELPDVEVFRIRSKKALQKPIKDVVLNYPKISGVSERMLKKYMKNSRFTKTGRQGKYLFLRLKNNYTLVLHFGMTGDLVYFKDKQPKHSALSIKFNNNNLAFISVRKLGKIFLVENKKDFIEEKQLGPDALSLNKNSFMRIIKQAKGAVKSALMDQSRIAGIGNIYSDEILYQAKVNPRQKTAKISSKQLENIYKCTVYVLKTAIKRKADPGKMPPSFLLNHRANNSRCGLCTGKIKKTKIGSRSAYYCPKHQKL